MFHEDRNAFRTTRHLFWWVTLNVNRNLVCIQEKGIICQCYVRSILPPPPQVGERKEKKKNQLLLLLKHVALLWFSINTALNILGRSARRLGDSPVCVFMCSSKYCFMLKSFPHHWHMNCLCPMWMLMWERSWYLYWKRSLQFWNIKNKTKKTLKLISLVTNVF